eukprot:s531_g3.t1
MLGHCLYPRKEVIGRYFKVGIKDQQPVFRSQAENQEDPTYNVPHTLYIWFDPFSKLWFISSELIMDITKTSPEWENTPILGSMDVDMKTVWVPWNNGEPANLRVDFGLQHERLLRKSVEDKLTEVESKLQQWQEWWHHGGSNLLLDLPPSCPPPPKGEKRLQPSPPSEPPPWKKMNVLPPPPPPVPGQGSTSSGSKEGKGEAKGDTQAVAKGEEDKKDEKPNFSWKARFKENDQFGSMLRVHKETLARFGHDAKYDY